MTTVFGFIDIQADFMNSNGALYVPNAETIKPTIKKLINFAESRDCPIFFTQDQHDGTESEMAKNGGVFPLHCLKNTEGAQNIPEADNHGAVFFEKKCYDVFNGKQGNNRIVQWLKDNNVTNCYISGVVGNICVEAACIGLRKLGINVYIFEEAVVWMDLENGIFCEGIDNKEKSVKRLRDIGCHFVRCWL